MACMSDREAMRLAKHLSGVVDVVLGGHKSIASDWALSAGDVVVSRCGMSGQFFSTTRLILSPEGEIIDWGGRNYLLDARWPSDDEMQAEVEEVRVEAIRSQLPPSAGRASHPPSSSSVPPPAGGTYLGAETCRTCHSGPYHQWETTAHAHAFDPQADGGQLARLVTGFGRPEGYRSDRSEPDLRGVQCEACHGPGSEHTRGGGRTMKKDVCSPCHGEAGWDFAAAMEKVRH